MNIIIVRKATLNKHTVTINICDFFTESQFTLGKRSRDSQFFSNELTFCMRLAACCSFIIISHGCWFLFITIAVIICTEIQFPLTYLSNIVCIDHMFDSRLCDQFTDRVEFIHQFTIFCYELISFSFIFWFPDKIHRCVSDADRMFIIYLPVPS